MQDHMTIHSESFVVDAHADTLAKVMKSHRSFFHSNPRWHIDFPRLLRGGVNLQFMAVYTPPQHRKADATLFALRMISRFYDVLRESGNRIMCVLDRNDLALIERSRKIGFLLSIEGGSPLAGEIRLLEVFFRLGVRAFTLTHNVRNELGDGAYASGSVRGLTRFGKAVVRELFKLGMLVDVAHLARPGIRDVIKLATGPIISSHTGVRTLCNIKRNLDDDAIRWIASTGGAIGIDFLPSHLRRGTGQHNASIHDVVRHVEYVANLVGVDHVGLGSDFDGFRGNLPGLEDVSLYANITEALLKHGFKKHDVKKILGGNFARVLRKILPASSSHPAPCGLC